MPLEFEYAKPANVRRTQTRAYRWYWEDVRTGEPGKEIVERRYYCHVLCDGDGSNNQKVEVTEHEFLSQEGIIKNDLAACEGVSNLKEIRAGMSKTEI